MSSQALKISHGLVLVDMLHLSKVGVSSLVYDTCSSVGSYPILRCREWLCKKRKQNKAGFIPKRFIATLKERGRDMTSRTNLSLLSLTFTKNLVFTHGSSALGLFVLACIFLCNSIIPCLHVLAYKSLNVKVYSLPSSSLLMPLVFFSPQFLPTLPPLPAAST